MRKISFVLMGIVLMSVLTSGCMRPYQKPIFVEFKPYESGFVVPLEGDINKQDAFGSAELLLTKKVAARRVEIPTRWIKLGRGWWSGEYKPTLLVVTVDRTPVSKQFTADATTGTSNKNQGLYAESRDSIGVSSGFAITASVQEEDAHLFLNKFKGGSLSDVMDNQVFNSVQSVYTEVCNKYNLKELREKKQEITDKMRESVIPMYKEWGITINPDMGLIGGFLYEDKEIQKAINDVFVNQTKKEANEALRDAQEALNQQRLSAKENDAKMFLVDKNAESEGIAVVAKAIREAGAVYIQNKQLEVFSDAIKIWNGSLPTVFGSGGIPMMFNMPLPSNVVTN